MMTQTTHFSTASGDGYDFVRIPYGGGGFAAYVLLPKGNSTAALLHTSPRQHLTPM